MNNFKKIAGKFNLNDNTLISLFFALFLAASTNIDNGMGGAAILMLLSQPLKTDLTSKNIFQAAAQRT